MKAPAKFEVFLARDRRDEADHVRLLEQIAADHLDVVGMARAEDDQGEGNRGVFRRSGNVGRWSCRWFRERVPCEGKRRDERGTGDGEMSSRFHASSWEKDSMRSISSTA